MSSGFFHSIKYQNHPFSQSRKHTHLLERILHGQHTHHRKSDNSNRVGQQHQERPHDGLDHGQNGQEQHRGDDHHHGHGHRQDLEHRVHHVKQDRGQRPALGALAVRHRPLHAVGEQEQSGQAQEQDGRQHDERYHRFFCHLDAYRLGADRSPSVLCPRGRYLRRPIVNEKPSEFLGYLWVSLIWFNFKRRPVS